MDETLCDLQISSTMNDALQRELADIESQCFQEFINNLSLEDEHNTDAETSDAIESTSFVCEDQKVEEEKTLGDISPSSAKDPCAVDTISSLQLRKSHQESSVSGTENEHEINILPQESPTEEKYQYLSSFMEVDDVMVVEDVPLTLEVAEFFQSEMAKASLSLSIGDPGIPALIPSPMRSTGVTPMRQSDEKQSITARDPGIPVPSPAPNRTACQTALPQLDEKPKSKRVGRFPCRECDLIFRQSGNLRKHVDEIHRKRKPFACTECPSKFSRKHARDTHLRAVHHKLRPFQCSDCFKRYKNRSDLNKHVRTVERKEKPYACDVCKKGFGERGKLKRHMSVHASKRG